MRSTKLATAIVLTLAMAGGLACSEETGGGGGTGGKGGSGGSGGSSTGGRGGSGGSSTGGTGGSSTGGTGGSSTGGTGGSSTGGTGGSSTGGTGGSSTGGTGGSSTGGSGGSGGSGGGGGSGGSGGSGGGGGSSADGGKMDRMGDGSGGMEAGNTGAFALTVSGVDMRNGKLYFKSGQTRGTGQMSPGFSWGAHPEAKSYALSMYDRTNNSNTHWVMYDIPATVTMLPPNLAHMTMSPEVPGARHTSFAGGIGYFGPGAGSCNTYVFEVHALKVEKLMVGGASNNNLRNMILANAMNRAAKTPEVLVIGNTGATMCN
jgi:phosphatidylethanolamine-binding protein (PEBP) family uncharacterized protein